uniref:Uncharacterized protein n=1 Tax=Triticum urartu TaxID=4572 RepID=A0A8R7QBI1_TRIUA
MPSARTAPSPSAPALLGRPRPFAWSPRMCCSTPAPAGGRRPPRRLCCFAPANPGLLACSAGLCCPGLAVNKQQADWDGGNFLRNLSLLFFLSVYDENEIKLELKNCVSAYMQGTVYMYNVLLIWKGMHFSINF